VLSSTINALYQKKLTEQELSWLLQELQKRGVITVSGNKIAYA
jgi:hypothetical protein